MCLCASVGLQLLDADTRKYIRKETEHLIDRMHMYKHVHVRTHLARDAEEILCFPNAPPHNSDPIKKNQDILIQTLIVG